MIQPFINQKNTALFFLVMLFLSCNPSETNTTFIEEAEKVVWDDPEKALTILSRVDSLNLNKEQHAKYILALIQARGKAKMDISQDTVIFEISDYFKKKDDLKRAALSIFYAGRVYQLRNKKNDANQAYFDALEYAEKAKDKNLMGLILINIGILYFEQGHYQDAIKELKKSILHIKQSDEYTIIALTNLGNSFYSLDKMDSAFIYFKKALNISIQSKNSDSQSYILHNIGAISMDEGEYQNAKVYYQGAIPYLTDQGKANSFTNLARIYFNTGQIDSAKYCAKQAYLLIETFDVYSSINLLELLYWIEKEDKEFANALNYHEQLLDSVIIALEKQSDISLLEMQKKYDTKLLENKVKIKNQQIILWVVASLLAITIICLWMYHRILSEKKKTEEAYRELEIIRKMAASFDEKSSSYRNIALQHFEIFKKAALIEKYLSGEEKQNPVLLKKIKKLIYGGEKFKWNQFFFTINTLQDGYFQKAQQLFEEYPKLDELDFKIWCLSYADFTQDEISLFLDITVRNIQTRNKNIRNVMGMDKKGDIKLYLEKTIKEKYTES